MQSCAPWKSSRLSMEPQFKREGNRARDLSMQVLFPRKCFLARSRTPICGGAGFSLWGFVLARSRTQRLKSFEKSAGHSERSEESAFVFVRDKADSSVRKAPRNDIRWSFSQGVRSVPCVINRSDRWARRELRLQIRAPRFSFVPRAAPIRGAARSPLRTEREPNFWKGRFRRARYKFPRFCPH